MPFELHANILYFLVAGFCSALYVVPVNWLRRFEPSQAWRLYCFIGLILLPLLFMLLVFPYQFHTLATMPTYLYPLVIGGGLFFGVGQACFCKAVPRLGMPASFAVNIGLGVSIGTLFTVAMSGLLLQRKGALVLGALGLILTSIYLFYLASPKEEVADAEQGSAVRAWIFLVIAGLSSGGQGITFYLAQHGVSHAGQQTGSFWIWLLFLASSAVPMYWLFSSKKGLVAVAETTVDGQHAGQRFFDLCVDTALVFVMGLSFTGSLVLYSLGMDLHDKATSVIAWPAFMITIVLGSVLLSRLFEGRRLNRYSSLGIVLMVTAMVLLAI